jgi:hypothetical protein
LLLLLCNVDLILADHFLIKLRYDIAIVDLLETVKIDGTVVHAKLVHSDEWDRHVLLIQIYDLHEHISAIDLSISQLHAIVENRDPVDLCTLRHEEVGSSLQFC